MRTDRMSASATRPARRRFGVGVVLAVLAMVAGGLAIGAARRSKEGGIRPQPSAYGTHSMSGGHPVRKPVDRPVELGTAEARAKALREVRESRDQVERMKAQGIGQPAARRQDAP